MNSVYIAQFSNGCVKVGRSDAPELRVEQHRARVACLGVTVKRWEAFPCARNSVTAERALIDWCVKRAANRNLSEWFDGIDFDEALRAMPAICADSPDDPQPLYQFLSQRTRDEREDFAKRCGTTLGHMNNVMYGYKPCSVDLAVAIERESQQQITAETLCPQSAETIKYLRETKAAA